jgi:proton glutamate symport protein
VTVGVVLLAIGVAVSAAASHLSFPAAGLVRHGGAVLVGHGGEGVRWLGILVLAGYAARTRSLTPWIFVAMVAGAEIGFDFSAAH